MRKAIIPFLFLAASSALSQNDAAVLTVDGRDVSRQEFEAIYKKNNKDAPVTQEALDEYMELFINYKLKVREAEALGMDTISKFQKELAGYREQLARPYLIDRELNTALLQEAYDRMQVEMRASHILLQLAGDAAPADTMKVYERIMKLRERIAGGEDFAKVAKSPGGSEDPSVKDNEGDLGWFTALQMVYPFENRVYNTPVGEVSMPVRTRFGYHLIKVTGKRPARGEIKVAHIMLRATPQDDEEKQKEVERRIKEIHSKVLEGKESFADLALRYSEDEGSSAKGGELPKFGTGKMIDEFENVAFALEKDGDVSAPFKTRYGWHIVKRLEYEPLASFETVQGQLKSRISKDSRADITRSSFIKKLKNEYGYKDYTKNLDPVIKMVDTRIFSKGEAVMDTLERSAAEEGPMTRNGVKYDRSIYGVIKGGKLVNIRSRQYQDVTEASTDTVVVRDVAEGWSYDPSKAAKLKKPLFSFDGRNFTQQQFLEYLQGAQRRGTPEDIKVHVNKRFEEWVDKEVIDHENGLLESKYPEFRMLMKEYRDGILLFELTDQKVWSKAVQDSTGLASFHEANKDQFMWPQRWNVDIYTCEDRNVARTVRRMLAQKKTGKEMSDAINKGSSLALNVEQGIFSATDKPFLASLDKTGLSKDMEQDGQVVIVNVKEMLAPSPKELSDARGLVTAAYQDHLEKAWIEELRAKYPVQVHKQVLYSIQ